MRFVIALIVAALITGFIVSADSIAACTGWCATVLVMLNMPGSVVLFFGSSLAIAYTVTFVFWFLLLWLLVRRRRRHRHHVHDRIPHRRYRRRRRYE